MFSCVRCLNFAFRPDFWRFDEQLRAAGVSMMAESDVSRRNVVEGAAVLGGAVLASPAVAGAKESQGFLNPGTYDKKKDFRAPVVRFYCPIRCIFR